MDFSDSFSMLGMAEWNAGTFFASLLAIVVIDLVLAGDNAIVIAMATRNLPDHLRRKAILWGTAGAIIMRVLMTIGVVWLLNIPGLLLVGGLALLWIAYHLLTQSDEGELNGVKATTMATALKTIIIADTLMGIDNVLGVAGAAKGSMVLVIIGLLISVPIMVWGSTRVLQLIQRFPLTIFIGAAILVYTAMRMIVAEHVLHSFWDSLPGLNYAAYVLGFMVVLGGGWLVSKRRGDTQFAK